MRTIYMIALLALTAGLRAERLAVTFDDNFFQEGSTDNHHIEGPHAEIPVIIHVVSKGETLSGLAKQFYGDPMLWPILFYDNLGRKVDNNYAIGESLLSHDYLPVRIHLSIRMHLDPLSIKQAREWCIWYYGFSGEK